MLAQAVGASRRRRHAGPRRMAIPGPQDHVHPLPLEPGRVRRTRPGPRGAARGASVPDLVAPLLVGHEQDDVRGPGHGRRLGPCRDDEDRAVGASRPHGYRGRGGGRCGATGGTGRIPTGCGARMIRIHWLVKGLGPGGAGACSWPRPRTTTAHGSRSPAPTWCRGRAGLRARARGPRRRDPGASTSVTSGTCGGRAAAPGPHRGARSTCCTRTRRTRPASAGSSRTMPRQTRPATVYTLHNTWESFARPDAAAERVDDAPPTPASVQVELVVERVPATDGGRTVIAADRPGQRLVLPCPIAFRRAELDARTDEIVVETVQLPARRTIRTSWPRPLVSATGADRSGFSPWARDPSRPRSATSTAGWPSTAWSTSSASTPTRSP